MAPVIFPDVELWASAYLRDRLAAYGYPAMFVSNRRESQVPAVWVRRDGGPVLDQVREAARLGINVFHTSEQAVNDLARRVSALMRDARGYGPVLRVQQTSGPSPVAVGSGEPLRRYMTFEVWVRGSDL